MKVFIIAAVVAVVAADSPPPSRYPAPAPSYPTPAPKYAPYKPVEEYPPVPPKYAYGYEVQDKYTGADFGQEEARDGYLTQGSYRVALPDGRIQTVTYKSEGDAGFVADVQYEGEAQYPKYEPKYPAPQYGAYPAPAPKYPAPAPAPKYPAPKPAPKYPSN
ncbi:cuticle protein 7-like [Pollicipes pollicipes]|uniref:cuticle protein 7-like n=1 Tax=Pollicipes pollicipes TaxID=41117 RepID=UPI001885242B|nr:cuticle protein 7-like [Pollicipes pollicipes]